MKNFKKVLALVLAIATLLSFATVASAKTADFADAKDVKNVEAVDVLSYINVLEGYPADKSFKPAKNITREEAAKIIAIFANKSTDISSLYTSANPFADMKGRWGESYVAYGYRAGIIAGKNATSFVPKANVKKVSSAPLGLSTPSSLPRLRSCLPASARTSTPTLP